MAHIACITPMYFSDESYIGGGERYPLNLARGIVEASGGAYAVELISFGPTSRSHQLAPGLTVRVLAAARPPINPLDVVSWELPEAIADADLVHIHQAYTRCSEVGLPRRQAAAQADLRDRPRRDVQHARAPGRQPRTGRPHRRLLGLRRRRSTGPSTPITVIKGGVDGARFTPAPRPVDARPRPLRRPAAAAQGDRPADRGPPPDLPLTVCGRPYHAEYFERPQGARRGEARRVRHRRRRRRRSSTSTAGPGSTSSPRSTATATADRTSAPS